ncbi:hypothetical protein RIF29_08057 [Crotalaria pallida]|uniref:HMA domain-containing protein n=1 Tax=Crotalaria pallida TaxID=3830 RepID=A0AAN9PCF8_CROPI
MDAKSEEHTSEPLKYQTWFLKVYIHCEGCRRKVKKVLRSIDGVFTTTIDPQLQKVTVTGSVGVETLIRKLLKAGKRAEVWPENLSGKAKGKKKNEQRDQESVENHAESKSNKKEIEGADKCNNSKSKTNNLKTGGNSPGKSPAANQAPEPDHKGGQSEGGDGKRGEEGSGKKKKKKGQSGGNGNGNNVLNNAASNSAPAHTGSQFQMNLSPTRQQTYPYAETYYPPLVYFSTYNNINNLYPMGRMMDDPSYYVPQLPYMSAGLDYDHPYYYHQVQSAPLVSFEIFSDENANWCSIM